MKGIILHMIPFPYIDLHSDTITALCYPFENLCRNRRMINIDRMRQGGTRLQCFAAFIPTGQYPAPVRDFLCWNTFLRIARKKDRLLLKHKPDFLPVLSAQDLSLLFPDVPSLPEKAPDKIGLLFTLEDSGILGTDISKVQTAYNRGIRIATLTWNHENTLAYPCSDNPAIMQQGLKHFGFAAIEEMNRLGILIDVSHLSDGGFLDVAAHSKVPFIASHSNSRFVTRHPRNLTDKMIRILADKGGVMGLNFVPDFLKEGNRQQESNISDMVAHICHIRDIAGSEVLAIGSDFDGIHGLLQIQGPQDMPLLYEALHIAGLTHTELENMWQRNACRVLKDVLSKSLIP